MKKYRIWIGMLCCICMLSTLSTMEVYAQEDATNSEVLDEEISEIDDTTSDSEDDTTSDSEDDTTSDDVYNLTSDDGGGDTTSEDSEDGEIEDAEDVGVNNQLTAEEGQATIVELTKENETGNQVNDMVDQFGENEDSLVYDNDLPSYIVYTETNLETNEVSTPVYFLTETGEQITLPAGTPAPEYEETNLKEPVGNIQALEKTTVSDNAIEKAIENSLVALEAGSTSLTISVSAGTYSGDIEINSYLLDDGIDLDEFILYILVEGTYSDEDGDGLIDTDNLSTDVDGIANFDGIISIDGVNVVIAGLYFSVTSSIELKDSMLEVYGTNEDDTIAVNVNGTSAVTIYGGNGNDEISIAGDSGGTKGTADNYTLYGNDGDDTVEIDLSIATNTTGITVDAGSGEDRLHLTGSLEENGSHLVSTSENTTSIDLDAEKGAFNLTVIDMENFTDELLNKSEMTLDLNHNTLVEDADGTLTYDVGDVTFTNYIIDLDDSDFTVDGDGTTFKSISITGGGFLTNLVIDGDDTDKYTITNISAESMNIVINGKEITITGAVNGNNILITAYNDDSISTVSVSESLEVGELFDDELDQLEMTISTPVSEATIWIQEGAVITASGAVILSATVEQLTEINLVLESGFPVVVKVGSATILIDGEIISDGTVEGRTSIDVAVEADAELLATVGSSLGINISVAESYILISSTGSIIALGSVALESVSTINISATSAEGVFPISLSVGIIVADVYVETSGDITSTNGDILMSASGQSKLKTISSEVISVGNDETKDIYSYMGVETWSDSSAYVSISVVVQNVYVAVLGNASLSAGQDIVMQSDSDVKITTKAVSMNVYTAGGLTDMSQSTQQIFTIFTSILSSVITHLGDSPSSKITEAVAKVDSTEDSSEDSSSVKDTVDNATEGAKNVDDTSSTSTSLTQLTGALGVGVLVNSNEVLIDTTGTITAGNNLILETYAVSQNSIKADGSQNTVTEDPNTETTTTTGAGTATAVLVTTHLNYVTIENGTIYASGVILFAESGSESEKLLSQIIAYAGYSVGDFGLAGATGIAVSAFITEATIKDGVTLYLKDGVIDISASSYEMTTNTVSGMGNPNSTSSVGVGSAIAITVTGVNVIASIEDNVKIILEDDTSLLSVNVATAHSAYEYVKAIAGSSGGVAVTPVLATLLSGVNVKSYVGSGEEDITTSGDINIEAMSSIIRVMEADASAVGEDVAIGGAFSISIVIDSVEAKLYRNTNSKNLTVRSSSQVSMRSTNKSGAKGASSTTSSASTDSDTSEGDEETSDSEKGESDRQADKVIDSVSKLASQTKSTNVTSENVTAATKDRQTAQTTEGNIDVAASFNLNVELNSSIAEIGNGLVNITEEDMTIYSTIVTDAKIYANASATNSTVGVGVAIAIQVLVYSNEARLGDGSVTVGNNLTVAAEMAEADVSEEVVNMENTTEDLTVFDDYIQEIVESLVDLILDALGIDADDNLVSEVIAEIISDYVGIFMTQFLSGTGLEALLSSDIEARVEATLSNFMSPDEIDEDLIELATQFVLNLALTQFASYFGISSSSTSPFASTGMLSVSDQVYKALRELGNEIFGELINFDELKVLIQSSTFGTDMLNRLLTSLTAAGKSFSTATLDALTNLWDLSIKPTDYGVTNDVVTHAISGAGASDVGVAGSVAITILVSNTVAEIVTGSDNSDIKVGGILTISAQSSNSEDTVATAAVGEDGAVDTNIAAGGDSDLGDSSTSSSTDSKTYTIATNTPANGSYTVTDTSSNTLTTAAEGTEVWIVLTPQSGYTIDKISVTGTTVSFYVTDYTIKGGNVLFFKMIAENVTITVTFRALNDGETALIDTTTTATTTSGQSVGVGGSFAMEVGIVNVTATLGTYDEENETTVANRNVEAGALVITSDSHHSGDVTAVAGTDPLSGKSGGDSTTVTVTNSDDITIDVALAFNYVQNTVYSGVGSGAIIFTTGLDLYLVSEFESPVTDEENVSDDDGEPIMETVSDYVSVYIYSEQNGMTQTKSSGFAVGDKSAVGTSVAVNVAVSTATVDMLGSITSVGEVRLKSYAYNEDDAMSSSTATGADLGRHIAKYTQYGSTVLTDLAKGQYSGVIKASEDTFVSNTTADTVKETVDTVAASDGTETSSSVAASTNILRSQNASTTSTENAAVTEATDTANSESSGIASTTTTTSTSIEVAAALALNVVLHDVLVNVQGNITAYEITVSAQNDLNYTSEASGAAMSYTPATQVTSSFTSSSYTVAAAVAIMGNESTTYVIIDGILTLLEVPDDVEYDDSIGYGNLTITSDLTQNMYGDYQGLLGAQAVAGSLSGSDATATVSGAFATIISEADTKIEIKDGSELSGMNVTVLATDKSKLAVRAGAVSISSGSTVGVGASFGVIYANNDLQVVLGDDITIKANTVTIGAERKAVTSEDFSLAFGVDTLITDSTGLENGTYTPGLIDIKKDMTTANTGYTITVNFNTETVLSALDLLNFLSSNNYYIETTGGAISMSTDSTVSVAGAVSFLYSDALTQVVIGEGFTIEEYDATAELGSVYIYADDSTTTRILVGTTSASPSEAGVGISFVTLVNESEVEVEVGNQANIVAGSYKQIASSTTDIEVWTFDMVLAFSSSGNAIGGNIIGILLQNEISNTLGEGSVLEVDSDVEIQSLSNNQLLIVTDSASVSEGTVAVGGTISGTISQIETKVVVGDLVEIISGGNVTISSSNEDQYITVYASISAAKTADVAGLVHVILTSDETTTTIGENAYIYAKDAITIEAISNVTIMTFSAGLYASASVAVGATFIYNSNERTTIVTVGDGVILISENGCILIQADGDDFGLVVAVGLGVASTAAVTGVMETYVSNSTYTAEVKDNVEITAGDSIGVLATLDSEVVIVVGSVSISSNTGVGASVITTVLDNDLSTKVGANSILTAYALTTDVATAGIKLTNREERRQGIVISAYATENVFLFASSGAGAGTAAVTGVVNTFVNTNDVSASVNGAILTSGGSSIGVNTEDDDPNNYVDTTGDILIEAEDDMDIINLSGAASLAGTAGVGATVVTEVIDRNVTATLSGELESTGDITVQAITNDSKFLLVIAFGAAGSLGAASNISVLVFSNEVTASLGGTVISANNINVLAETYVYQQNYITEVAVGGAAGTGAFIVTYFENDTKAYILDDTVMGSSNAKISGDITISAKATEYVEDIVVGLAASSEASAGGTAVVNISFVNVQAYIGKDTNIYTEGDVFVLADNTYETVVSVGTLAVSVVVGTTLTAYINVSYDTVTAMIQDGTVIYANDVSVIAVSNRSYLTLLEGLGGGGDVGVGIGITVIVIGDSMNEEAYDALYYSDDTDTVSGSTMDLQLQIDTAMSQAHSSAQGYDLMSLDTLLDGNDQYISTDEYDDYGQEGGADATSVADENHLESCPIEDLEDAITAIIEGSTIYATGDVNVVATDDVDFLVVTVMVAAGLYAGVGITVTVAVLTTNIIAEIDTYSKLYVEGDVLVYAFSGSGDSEPSLDTTSVLEQQEEIKAEILETYEVECDSDVRIMLISMNLTGGAGGVSVDIASLTVFTQVNALMGGTIYGAENVLVEAAMSYGNVSTIMVGGAIGIGSVVTQISVVYMSGEVTAAILGSGKLYDITGTISVNSNGDTKLSAQYGALGGAGVAVNVGLAIVINRTVVRTYIESSVWINSELADIYIATNYSADANVYAISVAAGIGAGVVLVGVVVNQVDAMTYMGANADGSSTTNTYNNEVNTITILSEVSGNITIDTAGGTAGGLTLNANVAVGVNESSGIARYDSMNLIANNLMVSATLQGDVDVNTLSITGYSVSVGAVVIVGVQESINQAIIDITDITLNIANDLNVIAGTEENPVNSDVNITAITGSAGNTITVAVNVLVASNDATNTAAIIGSDGKVYAKNVNVLANGNTHAYGVLGNASVTGITASVAVITVTVTSTQEAKIAGTFLMNVTRDLTVSSRQNMDEVDGNIFLDYKSDTYNQDITKTKIAEAYLFSVSVSLATANSNTLVSTVDTVSRAYIDISYLVADEVTILNAGTITASADIDNLSYSFLPVGVMVSIVDAAGTYEASLQISQYGYVGNVTIENTYVSQAYADVTPATGGVDISFEGLEVNVAAATVSTNSSAYIDGQGLLVAQNIEVSNTGTALANAIVHGGYLTLSGASLVSNTATASIEATQVAYIKDTQLQSDNVTILSYFNQPTVGNTEGDITLDNASESGAYATVGANYASVSMEHVDVNIALAESNSTVSAYTDNVTGKVNDQIQILTLASSTAYANVDQVSGDISLVSATISALTADANGLYQAYMITQNGDKELLVSIINVETYYYTYAEAETSPIGATAVEINGITIDESGASATAGTTAKAYISGDGNVTVIDQVNIQVDGFAKAYAWINEASWSFSLFNIGGQYSIADVSVVQEAYLTVNAPGTFNVLGDILIQSTYVNANAGAYATSGASDVNHGVTVSLLEGSGMRATATSSVTSRAYVSGSGTLEAYNLDVISITDTYVYALVQQATVVELVSTGQILAKAYATDLVEAYIKEIQIELLDSFNITAEGCTYVNSEAMEGYSKTVLSDVNGQVEANIGDSDTAQTVQIYLSDGASIQAQGDINIYASNTGSAISRLSSGFEEGAVTLVRSIVPTYSNYYTNIELGANTVLQSSQGNIYINGYNCGTADAAVTGDTLAYVVNGTDRYAENEMIQVLEISIGQNSVIQAFGDIDIQNSLSSIMTADTNGGDGGLWADGIAQAYNTLERNAEITISSNALIKSSSGNIKIESVLGEEDKISTSAILKDSALVALAEATAVLYLKKNETKITIGEGVDIEASAGDVAIRTVVGTADITITAHGESRAFGGNAIVLGGIYYQESNNGPSGNGVFSSYVNITGATIKGESIDISAEYGVMNITITSYAFSGGLGVNVSAKSLVNVNMDNSVTINNSDILGASNTKITATDNENSKITLNAYGKGSGGGGLVEVYGETHGTVDSNITISSNSYITGTAISVGINEMSPEITYDVVAVKTFFLEIIVTREYKGDHITYGGKITDNSTTVYETFTSTMKIELYEDADGNVVYETPEGHVIVLFDGDSLTLSEILSHEAFATPGLLVYIYTSENEVQFFDYSNQLIYSGGDITMEILNGTNLDLYLENLDLYQTDLSLESITLSFAGSGDVIINGAINYSVVSLMLQWMENATGNLYVVLTPEVLINHLANHSGVEIVTSSDGYIHLIVEDLEWQLFDIYGELMEYVIGDVTYYIIATTGNIYFIISELDYLYDGDYRIVINTLSGQYEIYIIGMLTDNSEVYTMEDTIDTVELLASEVEIPEYVEDNDENTEENSEENVVEGENLEKEEINNDESGIPVFIYIGITLLLLFILFYFLLAKKRKAKQETH